MSSLKARMLTHWYVQHDVSPVCQQSLEPWFPNLEPWFSNLMQSAAIDHRVRPQSNVQGSKFHVLVVVTIFSNQRCEAPTRPEVDTWLPSISGCIESTGEQISCRYGCGNIVKSRCRVQTSVKLQLVGCALTRFLAAVHGSPVEGISQFICINL